MTYEKLKNILEINRKLIETVEIDVQDFNDKFSGSENVSDVIFDIVREEAITLLLPLKDEGIGAIHFHIENDEIVIINTNQPICKMYFATVHDLYHIMFQNDDDHEDYNIHLNSETYNSSIPERKASLFAASLLMPRNQLKKAYTTFLNYTNSLEEIIIRLMVKFEAPLESVLLRLCEVQIITETEKVKPFVNLSTAEIEKMLLKYHQSNNIMMPTRVKDTSPLERYREEIKKKELIGTRDLDILFEEIKKYLEDISIGETI